MPTEIQMSSVGLDLPARREGTAIDAIARSAKS
jgi:hypothetical protein